MRAKLILEVIIDGNGNLERIVEHIPNRIVGARGWASGDENFSYQIEEVSVKETIIKKRTNMVLNSGDLNAWK